MYSDRHLLVFIIVACFHIRDVIENLMYLYCHRLIVADELDYLITKDRAVLHDLFMLTTFPFSRCILIGKIIACDLIVVLDLLYIFGLSELKLLININTGVANAIDLADRFLPRLKSLNCK